MLKQFKVDLRRYTNSEFCRGQSRLIEALWLTAQWLFVSSWIPGSLYRRFMLRLFGAKIGIRVEIKPGVRVKFPWRLTIGDHSWIGEGVWIDNLALVCIGNNCCLSQDAYLCTGSHDWKSTTFDLITRPIHIQDGAWIAARASVGPGVIVGEGAVLTLGSSATSDLESWGIYQGNPARRIGDREPAAVGIDGDGKKHPLGVC